MLKCNALLIKDTYDVASVQIMASILHPTDARVFGVLLKTLRPPEVTR